MNKNYLILSSIIASSCWFRSNDPAISSNYDFKNVGTLIINQIDDFPKSPKSGQLFFSNITHNFLKFGYDVNVLDFNQSSIHIKKETGKLLLSCVITEFTDSKMIVVPYRHEDRGYTKTIVEQSANNNKNDEEDLKFNQIQTSTTTTHGGNIKEGNRIEYTQSRVGIILKITDYNSGNLVWSNSYWYSGLEMQKTIESCVKTGVYQITRLFN